MEFVWRNATFKISKHLLFRGRSDMRVKFRVSCPFKVYMKKTLKSDSLLRGKILLSNKKKTTSEKSSLCVKSVYEQFSQR